MAVIAILAAIIFPVFSMVKEKGRETTCLNNLRQLGMGMRLYADDWNGHFPNSRVETGGDGNPSGNWAGVYEVHGKCDPRKGQIYSYIKSVGIYLCPSDEGVTPEQITDPNALPYPLSYSMNNLTDYRTVSCMEKASTSRVGLLIHEDRSSINDGDFYWLGWANGVEGYDLPGKMHNGGTCVLYCDLHVKWQHYDTVIQALRNNEWEPAKL